MAADRQRFWQRMRRLLRWCRVSLLALVLTGLVLLIYLNQAGLPEFLKVRLQTALAARGVDVQFERLYLSARFEIVAEAVALGQAAKAGGPQVHIGEVALQPDYRALVRGAVQVNGLTVRRGRLVWPLQETNQPPVQLFLEDIATELRFLPRDRWELQTLEARLLGAKLHLTGTVTNATALRELRLAGGGRPQAGAAWRAQARQALEVCQRLRFISPPDLSLTFAGDAREPATFTAELRCRAAGAQTPWGTLQNFALETRLNQPLVTNGWFHTAIRLEVEEADTPWVRLRQGRWTAHVAQPATNALPSGVSWELVAREAITPRVSWQSADLTAHSALLPGGPLRWRTGFVLAAGDVHSEWVEARTNRLEGWFVHSPTNLVPLEAETTLALGQVRSRWGETASAKLSARLSPAVPSAPRPEAAWGWWTNLAPYALSAQVELAPFSSPKLSLDSLRGTVVWAPAHCAITNLVAKLYGGHWDIPGLSLDVGTRELTALSLLAFDVRKLGPLFGTNAVAELAQLSLARPPTASLRASLVLPPWTNAPTNWPAAILPALKLSGQVSAGALAYREFPVAALQAAFTCGDSVWRVAPLRVTRPEGGAELTAEVDLEKRTCHGQLQSRLDPEAVRPLLGAGAQPAFGLFAFGAPPLIDAEFWTPWLEPSRTAVSARVVATNFNFRGETCDFFQAWVQFTNQFLVATNVRVTHGDEWVQAPAVGMNLTNYWVFLTNAQSRMDPMRVGRVISREVSDTIRPYQFLAPPEARVNGRVPAKGTTEAADMTFELAGGPFHYWRFRLPQVRGLVHWQGNFVTVTNLEAPFYQGRLVGDLTGDFAKVPGGRLRFHMLAQDADLHLLLGDLTPPTNRLEGIVSTDLIITRADAADWKSWQGYGRATMRDGLLWDLPLFGVFSPVLNSIAPGMGSSRAKAAKATYTIIDSIIHTPDLEITSPPIRLRYRGTVDFDGNVGARVEAVVFRGTPLIGPLISFAFSPLTKLFEYKVTGTLAEPKSEPLYIPKFLDSLLHPFRTLKGLLQGGSNPPPPNRPPQPPAR